MGSWACTAAASHPELRPRVPQCQAKGEARFGVYNVYLAKLHGSLTWKEVDHSLYEVPASEAWRDIDEFLTGFADKLSYLVLPALPSIFRPSAM